jgi:hypothetical protein
MTAVRLELGLRVFGSFLEFGKLSGFYFFEKLERLFLFFERYVSRRGGTRAMVL